MPTAAIIGASGFSGQETLDRVLAHPVTNEEALASGADVLFCCFDHERAAALVRGAVDPAAVVIDAGQAVQNANLALRLDETAGLRLHGVLV